VKTPIAAAPASPVFNRGRGSSPVFRLPSSGLSIFLFLLLFCGCATSYRSRGFLGDGYSEEDLGADRWRVTFAANFLTPPERIDEFLLFRCAELTVEKHSSFFLVVHGTEDDMSLKAVRPDLIDPPSWASNTPEAPGAKHSKKKRTVAVVIKIFKSKPAGYPKVYDAQELIQQLSPRMHSA